MAEIPAGRFRMGSSAFYPEEGPVREVYVDEFLIDRAPVTVGEFERFVAETGHVTLAERPPAPDDYPDADPDLLVEVGRLPPDLRPRCAQRPKPLVGLRSRGELAASLGPQQRQHRAGGSPGPVSSRMRTPAPTRAGPTRSCRQKPSGNARPGAGSRVRPSPGVPKNGRTANSWRIPGRRVPMAEHGRQGLAGDISRRVVSRKRLRAVRHDRQRVGSGPPITSPGAEPVCRRCHRVPAARRATHVASPSESYDSGNPGADIPRRVIKAARIFARRTTACAIALRLASPSRSTLPRAISAFAASAGQDEARYRVGAEPVLTDHDRGRPDA